MDSADRHVLDLRLRDARDVAASCCGDAKRARLRSTAAVAAARVARSAAIEVRIAGEHARAGWRLPVPLAAQPVASPTGQATPVPPRPQ